MIIQLYPKAASLSISETFYYVSNMLSGVMLYLQLKLFSWIDRDIEIYCTQANVLFDFHKKVVFLTAEVMEALNIPTGTRRVLFRTFNTYR